MLARADARRERRLQAAIAIQRNIRMLKARSQFLTTKAATLVLQSAWRGHVARSVAMDIRYATLHSVLLCNCTAVLCAATQPAICVLMHAASSEQAEANASICDLWLSLPIGCVKVGSWVKLTPKLHVQKHSTATSCAVTHPHLPDVRCVRLTTLL